MGTLQQLTAKNMGEEAGMQPRSISPIYKPIAKQDPDFKATDVAAAAAPLAMTVEDSSFVPSAAQEDV